MIFFVGSLVAKNISKNQKSLNINLLKMLNNLLT